MQKLQLFINVWHRNYVYGLNLIKRLHQQPFTCCHCCHRPEERCTETVLPQRKATESNSLLRCCDNRDVRQDHPLLVRYCNLMLAASATGPHVAVAEAALHIDLVASFRVAAADNKPPVHRSCDDAVILDILCLSNCLPVAQYSLLVLSRE